MLISDFVRPEAVLPGLRASTPKQVMQMMARTASQLSGIASPKLLAALQAGAAQAPMTLGGGIALPHGRILGLGRSFALFARLDQPVDMAALDGRSVDLVAMLFSPEADAGMHLRALAALSRLLRSTVAADMLRGCASADALHAVLTANPAARAA